MEWDDGCDNGEWLNTVKSRAQLLEGNFGVIVQINSSMTDSDGGGVDYGTRMESSEARVCCCCWVGG